MLPRLIFNTLLVWIVLTALLSDRRKGVNGWWIRRRKSKGGNKGGTTTYGIYSCPLDLSGKRCRKRGWLPYAPYGIRHTYVKIGNTCYDWGNWNYSRHVACTKSEIACCTEDATKRYSGSTKCADRVGAFEDAWEATRKKYSIWSWNCQTYVNAMKRFLNNCYADAGDAIP